MSPHRLVRARANAAGANRRARGFTLIEVLTVLALIAIVTGVAIAGTMELPSARLRRSATMIVSAIKVAYTRATSRSRDVRLVMDLDAKKIWLEEADVPMLVQSKDKTHTGGADPVTDTERAAIVEGEQLLRGPGVARPRFHPVTSIGFADFEAAKGDKYGKPLQNGITFRSVQIGHDDAPRTSGRAYLYFWPGGMTERAAIQVHIGEGENDSPVLTLDVSPLTGKVTVKAGAVDLKMPEDDEQKSDRPDSVF
jgi:general secretion pathway protein H